MACSRKWVGLMPRRAMWLPTDEHHRPPRPSGFRMRYVWRPSPFIAFSVGVHGAAIVGWIWNPDCWPYALGAMACNQVAIIFAGLLPKSALLGSNLTRLPAAAIHRQEVAITIDDGPTPEVTPRVLEILETFGAKATFFCIGDRVQRYPDLCRKIVACGHLIENHGQTHRKRYAFLGYRGWLREVGSAQETIAAVTGRAPRCFRALAGIRNPFLDPVLARFNIRLASWTHRGFDTRVTCPDQVFFRLTRHLSSGDILLLHDGNCARSASGMPIILEVLPRLLQEIKDRNLNAVTLEGACDRH